MKKRALVICPGRGTYNAAELGYVKTHHAARQDVIATVDAIRTELGQVTVSQLDNAAKYAPSVHMTGDNASALIYACAMADFAAIDRERYEIVAVTGNSMGWYLALACAGIVDLADGARLVNNMGGIMHQDGTGGQIVWSVVDDNWNMRPDKILFVQNLLAEARINSAIYVDISIRLGGMIVFAADEAGLKWLTERLPKDDRFPLKLMHHAAFHSPLLNHVIPMARAGNPVGDFGTGEIPAIDGQGRIWSPRAFSREAIYDYTFGAQLTESYNFTRAVQVAAAEFAPETIIVLGPGTTLGAPTVQALIASGWRGLSGKADFQARQQDEPMLISMGMAEQRAWVLS
ncbi:ACP S-malonyltransferase [Sphingorhabdus sp. EL138]|uniref:ACP S-malonyltransferase n=1 Tax=Sphingorhabdus sp. EL138 TaxID=2073156 RepID=UPI0025F20154|nr:ACP S-malonyltransferase [Sphingorhabdus sp. EL138]